MVFGIIYNNIELEIFNLIKGFFSNSKITVDDLDKVIINEFYSLSFFLI
jgi:hypothetical protein